MAKNIKKMKLKYKDKKEKLNIRKDLLSQIEELDRLSPNKTDHNVTKQLLKIEKKKKYEKFSKKNENLQDLTQMRSWDFENSLNCKIEKYNEIKESLNIDRFDKVEKIDSNRLSHENITLENRSPEIILGEDVRNFDGENTNSERKIELSKPILLERNKLVEKFRKSLEILDIESELISLLREDKMILVNGETGCGKSTQIPQMLIENGYKRVLLTQPRRIGAIGVCNRINYELRQRICGYKVRYDDKTDRNTRIKIVTDGMLLEELNHNPLLKSYDVVIIDEAHERNVNIDLLIPILTKLAQNKKIKLIVMSATLNFKFEWFSVLNVDSTKNKVKIFYKSTDNFLKGVSQCVDQIIELENEGISSIEKKDLRNILVFLPSKRDIYYLKKLFDNKYKGSSEILPIHSNLSRNEQQKVFEPSKKRKIILATNIAETSITIPKVFYVIDSGLEKRKFFNNGHFKYKITLISKSSAIQRTGRAGREGPGMCFRLYNKSIYMSMEENRSPEILNISFENYYLQLLNLGINPKYFPFIDEPDLKYAEKTLKVIGLIDSKNCMTDDGKKILSYSLPVRLARIMASEGSTKELLFIFGIMALNIELEIDIQFKDEKSDLIAKAKTILNNENKFFGYFPDLKNFMKFYGILNLSFDENNCDEIRQMLFMGFCDKLCERSGDSYVYKNDIYFLDKNSCDITDKYIIFDYIIETNSRKYLKNVTTVDFEWF